MAKYEYPEIDGMDSILLTLAINHKGNWMEVYDSLQIKEDMNMKQVLENQAMLKNNNCGFTTLINEEYPQNLKTIYKPPFGVFYKGDAEAIKGQNAINTITVIGDHLEALKTVDKNANLLWVNKTSKEVQEILKLHPTGNIFYSSEFKEVAKQQEPAKGNCFISEIWEKSKEKDYSNQQEERMFLGITKQVLITPNAKTREVERAKQYANTEDVKILGQREKEKTKEFTRGM